MHVRTSSSMGNKDGAGTSTGLATLNIQTSKILKQNTSFTAQKPKSSCTGISTLACGIYAAIGTDIVPSSVISWTSSLQALARQHAGRWWSYHPA